VFIQSEQIDTPNKSVDRESRQSKVNISLNAKRVKESKGAPFDIIDPYYSLHQASTKKRAPAQDNSK